MAVPDGEVGNHEGNLGMSVSGNELEADDGYVANPHQALKCFHVQWPYGTLMKQKVKDLEVKTYSARSQKNPGWTGESMWLVETPGAKRSVR